MKPFLAMVFGGSSGATVTVPNASVNAVANFPASANASITYNDDGTYSQNGVAAGLWRDPSSAGAGAGYEIRWTPVSGTLTTGATSTWQSLSTPRTYGRLRTSIGLATASGTVEIRDAGTAVVESTGTNTLEAEVV